jgi:hypothetical protein
MFSRLSWILRPAYLRTERSQDTLFVGPWLGEFGWELMNWQAWARKVSASYAKTIVCARESSRALYEDFYDEFIPHSLTATGNCHVGFDVQPASALEELCKRIPQQADHLIPRRYVPRFEQEFVRLGIARTEDAVDVVIHARGREFVADRNWSLEEWQALCGSLLDRGLRIAAVGLRSATLPVEGVEDRRDISLQNTMDCMASSRLVIGPSSGPLHLASLCGTSHLVWTDRRTYGMGKTSREKYESWWNPLETPVQVVAEYGFRPPVEVIRDQVLQALDSTRESNT